MSNWSGGPLGVSDVDSRVAMLMAYLVNVLSALSLTSFTPTLADSASLPVTLPHCLLLGGEIQCIQ